MPRVPLLLLLVAPALAGCGAPSTPVPEDAPTGVLVVGVFAEVVNATEAERVASRGGAFVSCDQLFALSANLTDRRLAYSSRLGLGRPDAASQWVELTQTHGPQPQDPARCPPDPYGLAFAPWGERPGEFVFGEYRARIPYAALPSGEVEVEGTRLKAGEHWTREVEETVNGTRYEGVITVLNLGRWTNVTEYACSETGCAPPFPDAPDLRAHAAAHPEGRRP